MKNLRARRFSKMPIRGDLRASMSFAGTLWTYGTEQLSLILESEAKSRTTGVQKTSSYLAFVKHKASVDSLEVQVLCNISMNENPYESTIRHYKLTKHTSISEKISKHNG